MALFGIKRIQYCKATQLAFSGQNNPFLGIASEPTNTFTDIVCMVNSRATLTIEQAVVNKQIVYTAKLQFVTPADPMLDVDHYAFIATTNEGERILLGANTRPQVAVVTAQGVFGNAGELTAYTTTAEFKADYRPLRLPVTAAEPISGPAYDICCGQIPQPTAPDARQFDICCGQIKTSEPISGPAYDVCCGEIKGETPPPPPPEPPHGKIVINFYESQPSFKYEYSADGKYVTPVEIEQPTSLSVTMNDLTLNDKVFKFTNNEASFESINWADFELTDGFVWVYASTRPTLKIGFKYGSNQPSGASAMLHWNYNRTASDTDFKEGLYYVGLAIVSPGIPIRNNYRFKGWATSPTGTPTTNFGNKTNAEQTFYAIWEAI